MPADRNSRRLIALVPAAGRGERFGGNVPKQWFEVCGRPLLWWALRPLLECGADRVVVGLPADGVERARLRLEQRPELLCVAGGRTRQDTVRRCLEAAPGRPEDLVLIHDGARPAVSALDVRGVISAASQADGAVLGRPVSDTLKRVVEGVVEHTVDRQGLFRAETPQVFRRALLEAALSRAETEGTEATDEASLVEGLEGVSIRMVTARWPNPKLTFAADLALIAALIESQGSAPVAEPGPAAGVNP